MSISMSQLKKSSQGRAAQYWTQSYNLHAAAAAQPAAPLISYRAQLRPGAGEQYLVRCLHPQHWYYFSCDTGWWTSQRDRDNTYTKSRPCARNILRIWSYNVCRYLLRGICLNVTCRVVRNVRGGAVQPHTGDQSPWHGNTLASSLYLALTSAN